MMTAKSSALFLLCSALSARADLQVMSWNLHHGEGLDKKTNLSRIAKVITDSKVDVVFLQEVDKNLPRSGKADQAVELGKLTGMHAAFAKAISFSGGEYGIAILSRYPLENTRVHPLPGPGEARVAFEATITIGGKPLRLVNTHLEAGAETARPAQARKLLEWFQPPAPTLLGGDFNDTAASETLKIFTAPWKTVLKDTPATFPADKPVTEIDHFLTLGCEAAAPAQVLPEAVASDHRPVLVRIAWK